MHTVYLPCNFNLTTLWSTSCASHLQTAPSRNSPSRCPPPWHIGRRRNEYAATLHPFNQPLGLIHRALRDTDPYGFQHIGYLAEQAENVFQSAGQQLMHPVFHRTPVAQVADKYLVAHLADALDDPNPLNLSTSGPQVAKTL